MYWFCASGFYVLFIYSGKDMHLILKEYFKETIEKACDSKHFFVVI
jgi:hypothetical protein